ncbi:hypothetical protein CORC01_07749 [Colletotrichum orchidophilum]|uniref:F-box domain-containing protein n=1 Tax=Colletotrichum orchidophilum TaxID=1209926 RepID=A0A1G4B6E2_9PEZI|nr:uncharacterized protein CORC01_07749 [Colletotrichum orchidophilum]OHE96964.1 hypothetical protein CORC01_07749 [Colletotrichum orchidophilum]
MDSSPSATSGSSLSPKKRLLDLPNELICCIVDSVVLLGKDRYDDSRNTQTISSLSRTCQIFHHLCNPQLYSTINLDESKEAAGLLIRSLIEAPELGIHLQRLTLRVIWESAEHCEKGLRRRLTQSQSNARHHPGTLPNLRHLELEDPAVYFMNIPDVPRIFTSLLALPPLTSILTRYDNDRWGGLAQVASAVPFALEQIRFHETAIRGPELCRLLQLCPGLRVLEIEIDYHFFSPCFQPATHPGITTHLSTALSSLCPRLQRLTLLHGDLSALRLPDEPRLTCLTDLEDLTVLETELPTIFRSPEDMVNVDIAARLPAKLTELTLHDIWYSDPRYCLYSLAPGSRPWIHERLDARTEPLTAMLLRLASSCLAGELPDLRRVAVKTPTYEHDRGNTCDSISEAFAKTGVLFELISAHSTFPCPLTR